MWLWLQPDVPLEGNPLVVTAIGVAVSFRA